MKSIFRLLTVMLLVVSVSFLVFNTSTATRAMVSYSDFEKTYLVTGFDDAAWHTDVISLINYKKISNQISVFQIPRDTFYNFGKSQNKINQLTATAIYEGSDPKEAMRQLKDNIRTQLCIDIDGFVAVTMDAFSDIVKTVGGVNIQSDKELVFYDKDNEIVLSIKQGDNHLTPEQALCLVRYRSGYLRGDLDRLELQKMFFEGFFKTVLQKSNPISLLTALLKTQGLFTDIAFSDILSFASVINDIRRAELLSFTLPGKAVKSESGLWYYALDRKAVVELLSQYFPISEEDFDKKRLFDIPVDKYI